MSSRLIARLVSVCGLCAGPPITSGGEDVDPQAKDLLAELKSYRHRIVYETWQDTNWELFMVDAEGSNPVNLTRTPNVNELYPHVSPDGTKVSFITDGLEGPDKSRDVYYMSIDGTGRTLVAKNAREPFWYAGGSVLVYLKGEMQEYTCTDYATKGLFFYDLKTGRRREHPNKGLHHIYNVSCTPDGKWFIATVHGGMGYKHGIIAIEADGMGVFDLALPGCRPDISPDGKRLAWGSSDWALCVADLDFSGPTPRATGTREIVTSAKPVEVYHIDWSPDSRYVAFSRGPKEKVKTLIGQAAEAIGVQAPGWNICVADPSTKNRWVRITHDGKSCKEPDWAPAR